MRVLTALCVLLTALAGCASLDTGALNDVVEKDRVRETVNRLFISTDNRDWPAVKEVFAPSVLLDMTSLAGGEPANVTPQEIADAWQQGLGHLKAVHHQSGNFLIEVSGDEATAFCYGIATHYLPNDTGQNIRTFVGSYDFHLVRQDGSWKIDRFVYNLKYLDGNPDLEKNK